MIDMLVGAVEALEIGDPLDYATDVGPVIDADAKEKLEAHKARMRKEARELVDLPAAGGLRGRHLRRRRRSTRSRARMC